MRQCFSKLTTATTGTGTRFQHPFGGASVAWGLTQGVMQAPVAASGTFLNLRVQVKTALAAGSSRSFTVYKNGSATSLSVTIPESDTTIYSDTVNTVTVAAGDLIALGTTLTGTNVNTIVAVSIEFESDTAAGSIYGGPLAQIGTTTFNTMSTFMSSQGASPGNAVDDGNSLWPLDGDMTALYVRLNTAPGGANSRIFNIVKNGTIQDGTGGTVDTTVTITGAAQTGNASFTLPVAAGDVLSFRGTEGGTPATSPLMIGSAFTSDVPDLFVICSSDQDQASATLASYSSQSGDHWTTTEANVLINGTITSFEIIGWRIVASAADNGRTFQPRVNGVDTGPTAAMAGGLTTSARDINYGLIAQAVSADVLRPGPMTSSPILRPSLVWGGNIQ
jgi:hypothetical protein